MVRVIDGREVEGRFISEYAYTLYAIAIDAEAHGDLETAREAFEAAAIEDEDSPEIWTGVGAVRCRLSLQGGSAGSSEEAFARARELDPEYEPLHHEQASCALAKGRLAEALGHAARAVELDPDRDETTLLYAAILEAMGRTDEARRAIWPRRGGSGRGRGCLQQSSRSGRRRWVGERSHASRRSSYLARIPRRDRRGSRSRWQRISRMTRIF